jgi:hypothetical protein
MKPAGRLRQKRAEGVRHNMRRYIGVRRLIAEGLSLRLAKEDA